VQTVVYVARNIITMTPSRPEATHVAVRDGRILAVGSLEEVAGWGDYRLDESFADKVLLPGFVEGHAHMMAGGIWQFTYAGFEDRIAPDGTLWIGAQDIDAVIRRLREAEAALAPEAPLIAWGFDPIFLTSDRLTRKDLDQVTTSRPVAVIHSNFHLMTVNSRALEMAQYDRNSDVEGIARGEDGEPNGELQEMAAMFPIMRRLGIDFRSLARTGESIRAYGKVCQRCGVTTATDLINDLPPEDVDVLTAITGEENYPARLVPVLNAHSAPAAEIVSQALGLRALSSDKLRLGSVKIITDGSIQGFTARMRWPGYFRGPDHGIWNIPPEQLMTTVETLNAAGVHMHVHVNGDEASEVAIEAFARALAKNPNPDHRHVLQHCQLADAAQFRRIRTLGLCVNLFANHLYYFGDKHYELTVGPERAERIDACGTALAEGIPLAIHSDAPVTPMGPLFTAWCAVNRVTVSGRVLGASERICVEAALRAVTLGPAYTLHLDHEIGSIEVGKKADFAVLEENPLTVDPMKIRDIAVWGTVLGGKPFPLA
jgi:hypothetical protein